MENFDKSFVEEWYVHLIRFAGQKTGEDWKYTIEDFPLLQVLHKMNIQIKIQFYIFCFSQKVL